MTGPICVYTDGACSGNPGPGGWAWAVPGGAFAAGHAAHSTNQRMELVAAYEAALAHPGPVEIVTDSTYVMNCFVKRWYVNWLKSGWRNSQKKPVANRDLWEPFVELYLARPDEITFRWVKGHSGDVMNDLVDRLAVEACLIQKPRSGDAPPDPATLGPEDVPQRSRSERPPAAGADDDALPGRAAPADGRVPAGHRLVVFGHRALELGGYDTDNPAARQVRRRLAEILAAKAELHCDLVVLTGLRLGAEMVAGEAAVEAGVAFVAVLPYPEPEKVWSAASQQRFRKVLGEARSVITLEQSVPTDKAQAGQALARRDGWLAANADEAVLVWDGTDQPLAQLHRKLLRRLDEGDIWVLAPGPNG